jgi:hypothetical protein
MAKCKDWASDPKMWVVVGVVTGVATAVATVLVTRTLNLQVAELKAKLQSAGIPE